jgi:hypothetical protein
VLSNGGSGDIYTAVESNILLATYTVTQLTPGTTYRFRVQARNVFGYSTESDYVEVLAAEVPETPIAPVTIFNRETIRVDWTAPFD